MRFNRDTLRVLGLLDAVLLGRHWQALSSFHLPTFSDESSWFLAASLVITIGRPVFLLSLAFSAFGLAKERRWGIILSYVQFPFRFLFLFLSFWFLMLIPMQMPMIIAAMVLEGLRLLITIAIHTNFYGRRRGVQMPSS